MDLKTFMMNLFMIIGIIVCVVVTVIALIYALCYSVKLLFKTFGAKISASYDVMMEDIREKKVAKKERNKEKRTFNNEHKKEMQKLKLLSEAEVFEMKKRKYRDKLRNKENKAWQKLYGETEPRQIIIPGLEEKSLEVCNSSVVDTLFKEMPAPAETPVVNEEVALPEETQTDAVAVEVQTMEGNSVNTAIIGEVVAPETAESQEPVAEETVTEMVAEESQEVVNVPKPTETTQTIVEEYSNDVTQESEGLNLNDIQTVENSAEEENHGKKRGRKKKK